MWTMPRGKEPHTIFARSEPRSGGDEQRLPTWWANLTHDSVCEAILPNGVGEQADYLRLLESHLDVIRSYSESDRQDKPLIRSF